MWEVQSCGKKTGKEEKREETELLTEEERDVEEPSCDSCPTSMHRCECSGCTPATLPHGKQMKPIVYRPLQKPSNFIQRFIQQLLRPNYVYVTCLIAINPLWLM